jgi:hypothetical protein
MTPRDALSTRKAALTGRLIAPEERALLESAFSAEFDIRWLIDLLGEFPLIGSILTLDENHDLSEMGVELRWLKPADMLQEAREMSPGKEVLEEGYLPVGECLLGSGDPYFLRMSDGQDPPVVRVPHDAPSAVEVVRPSLSDFLANAVIE